MGYYRYRPPAGYSTTKAVLDILLDLSEEFTLLDSSYNKMKRSYKRMTGGSELRRWRYERAVRYLEYMGKVDVIKKREKKFLKLTKKGKVIALLDRLQKDFNSINKWDGKWRLIIWDIPERYKKHRESIRKLVKSLGFYRLQHSVFITPYPLPRSAVEYLKASKLIDYVRFLRIDKIEDDSELKRHFNLRLKK